MTPKTKSGPQDFYCRLRGASSGRKIHAWDSTTARRMFAAQEDIPVNSPYITVCSKPTSGVVYGD